MLSFVFLLLQEWEKSMTSNRREATDKLIRDLDLVRFEQFQSALRHAKEVAHHDAPLIEVRDKRRAALLGLAGVDPGKLEATQQEMSRAEAPLMRQLLDDVRKRYVGRASKQSDDTKEQALRAEVLAGTGSTSAPVYGASMFTADAAAFKQSPYWNLVDDLIRVEAGTGWFLPTDAAILRARLTTKGDGIDKSLDLFVHYTFVPNETGTYDLTVPLTFHGWYYLRCIDSWWTSGLARVQMDLGISAHQYVDDWGWLANFYEQSNLASSNVGEYGLIDQTTSFSKSTLLKAGDPVVVTIQIRLHAFADGDNASYAEINFEDGAANYIQAGALVACLVS